MGFICQAWRRKDLELRVSSACILFPSLAKGLRNGNVLMDLKSRNLRKMHASRRGMRVTSEPGQTTPFVYSCESHLLVLLSKSN